MCMRWAARHLVTLEEGPGSLRGAEKGVLLIAGGCPCFCLIGREFIALWVGFERFLWKPRSGQGPYLWVSLRWRERTGKARSPLGNRRCTRTSMFIWCLVCTKGWAFSICPSLELSNLCALNNSPFRHLGLNTYLLAVWPTHSSVWLSMKWDKRKTCLMELL